MLPLFTAGPFCPLKSAENTKQRINGSSGGRCSDTVYLTATIGSQTESCLVDTGCQISLLPERLAPPGPRQEAPKLLRATNGTPIDVVGSVTINLKGYPVRADFLVSLDVDEIMLGMLERMLERMGFQCGDSKEKGRVYLLCDRLSPREQYYQEG